MPDDLIKYEKVLTSSAIEASDRLLRISKTRPLNLARILDFGLSHQQGEHQVFRLRFHKYNGKTLAESEALSKKQYTAALESLASWRSIGFLHGDISPRNIIVLKNRVVFTDFIVDINSYRATPKYAAPSVHRGIRSHATDCYALEKSLEKFSF